MNVEHQIADVNVDVDMAVGFPDDMQTDSRRTTKSSITVGTSTDSDYVASIKSLRPHHFLTAQYINDIGKNAE